MGNRVVLLVLLAGAALLQGCVQNQLLRQETQAFAATADKAATEGATFYSHLIESDRQLYAAFYVLDGTCRPPSISVDGRVHWLKEPRSKTPERWCADWAAPDTQTLSSELTYESFAREFAALSFMANYVAGLLELAANPEADAGKRFAGAAADINTLLAAANKDPVLNKDQIEAASGLFGFLQELSSEATSAHEIRSLLKKNGARTMENFQALTKSLLADSAFNNADLEARIATATTALKFRPLPDPFLRHTMLTGYYEAIDLNRTLGAFKARCEVKAKKADDRKFCGAQAAGLMHAASVAHADLLSLAAGDLNDAQKAKAAKLAYARFIGVVRLFVSLTGAF